MPEPTDQLASVQVERMVPGGLGFARAGERILLIPQVAPGDLIEVELPESGPLARLTRLLAPGPDRVEAACAHYGRCGGCDFMHLAYPAQLAAKRDLILDALKRTGGIDWQGDLEVVANPAPLGSRNRATWHPAMDGSAGYFQRNSHAVEHIDSCPVLDPVLEARRRQIGIDQSVTGLSNGSNAALTGRESGHEITFDLCGSRITAAAGTFFQSNLALLEPFVAAVRDVAISTGARRVLELYAGVGLFTVVLARVVDAIQAVEQDSAAHRLALINMADSGLTNAVATCARAEQWLSGNREQFDLIVVDPPRTGLNKSVRRAIATSKARHLLYVSCDPVTFARDSKELAESAFYLDSIKAFDMFPQTHHVELLALLTRTGH